MDDFSSPNITNAFGVSVVSPNNYIGKECNYDWQRVLRLIHFFLAPNKRPASSMCPAIIIDDRTNDVHLLIGGAGGTHITTGTAMVLARHLQLGESLRDALGAPRIHHQLLPNTIVYEKEFPHDILNGLISRGHNVTEVQICYLLAKFFHQRKKIL